MLVATLLVVGEMLDRTGVARAVGDLILKKGGLSSLCHPRLDPGRHPGVRTRSVSIPRLREGETAPPAAGPTSIACRDFTS